MKTTGTLKTALAGATTSVIRETAAGVTFDTTNEAIEATEDIDGTDISQASTGSLGIHPPFLSFCKWSLRFLRTMSFCTVLIGR